MRREYTKIYLSMFILFLMINNYVSAQTSRELAVELSANVQVSPPKITLQWKSIAFGSPVYNIYKKSKTASSWGTVLASLPSNAISYNDYAVVADSAYEYRVKAVGPTVTSTGYIYAGIKSPAIHNRGIMILLVDNKFSDSCSADLKILMNDLSGDGWQLIRHDISRTASDVSIKSIITNDYSTLGNVKAVMILGHLAVPYSGLISPDGHWEHRGAWPSDLYYSSIGSVWTDNSVNNDTSIFIANNNYIGDGKWDQTRIPGVSQLQISRLDFYDMPAFAATEIQLMKRYLAKNHKYKMDSLNVRHRGLIYDGFGDGFGPTGLEGFPANGWRNFSPLVSNDSITVVGYYQTISAMANTSYQWVYGCGGGTFTSCNHIGSTSDLAANPNNSIFTMYFGSYFGDWNVRDNFLRAMLCSNPPALTACWVGRPNWFLHHMALGENIGYSAKISQNNYNPSTYNTPIELGNGMPNVELLGDLSLRSDYIKPPSNLEINSSVIGNPILNWVPSSDPGVIGYYVYRSDSLYGFYQRLNTNMITSTTYNDTMDGSGLKNYMIRPVKLQSTPSGRYHNLGVGITNSFLRLGRDIQPSAFITPATGSNVAYDSVLIPQASYTNSGSDLQNNVAVRYRIIDSAGAVIYDQMSNISVISSGQTVTATFPPSNAITIAGTYIIRTYSELPGDQIPGNDSLSGVMTVLPDAITTKLNLTVTPEGLYIISQNLLSKKDTIKVYLRNSISPYEMIDSAGGLIDSIDFSNVYSFYNCPSGSYYIVAKNNNCIETWSREGGEYLVNDGNIYNYDFTVSYDRANGNNLVLKGNKYCIFSGDVDQDGVIDASDLSQIETDAAYTVSGNFNSDLTGDYYVDSSDLSIGENNSTSNIIVIEP